MSLTACYQRNMRSLKFFHNNRFVKLSVEQDHTLTLSPLAYKSRSTLFTHTTSIWVLGQLTCITGKMSFIAEKSMNLAKWEVCIGHFCHRRRSIAKDAYVGSVNGDIWKPIRMVDLETFQLRKAIVSTCDYQHTSLGARTLPTQLRICKSITTGDFVKFQWWMTILSTHYQHTSPRAHVLCNWEICKSIANLPKSCALGLTYMSLVMLDFWKIN